MRVPGGSKFHLEPVIILCLSAADIGAADPLLSPPPGTSDPTTPTTASPPSYPTLPTLAVVSNDDAGMATDNNCGDDDNGIELSEAAGIRINPLPPLLILKYALPPFLLPLPLMMSLLLHRLRPCHCPQCSRFRHFPYHHCCRHRGHRHPRICRSGPPAASHNTILIPTRTSTWNSIL